MRLVMMGTGSFAEPTFAALLASAHEVAGVFTQPDRPTGNVRGSTRQARRGIKEMAQERSIPVFQPESVNTPESVAQLQSLRPDLLVVAAYGQILSNDVLARAAQGGINVHASLLPKYRGAAPINWAIYHGEKQSGVTIIRMSVRLDAGDMLAQEAVDILPDETAGELEARLGPLGAKLAMDVIDRMARGEAIRGVKQDPSQVTKAPKLKKEHGLIDWTRTADEVCNQVRAMQPWPTAYTFLLEEGHAPLRLIVFKAQVTTDMHSVAWPSEDGTHLVLMKSQRNQAGEDFTQPGRALKGLGEERIFVACASGGWAEIIALQPAGKRRMGAPDFLRGHPLSSTARMGPANPLK